MPGMEIKLKIIISNFELAQKQNMGGPVRTPHTSTFPPIDGNVNMLQVKSCNNHGCILPTTLQKMVTVYKIFAYHVERVLLRLTTYISCSQSQAREVRKK